MLLSQMVTNEVNLTFGIVTNVKFNRQFKFKNSMNYQLFQINSKLIIFKCSLCSPWKEISNMILISLIKVHLSSKIVPQKNYIHNFDNYFDISVLNSFETIFNRFFFTVHKYFI
jgi:hypothetical protein